MAKTAGVDCPKGCSDAVDWEPLNDELGFLIGNVFTCEGCHATWLEMLPEPAGGETAK